MDLKELTPEDLDLLYQGLAMKVCYMETGNPVLRGNDLERMGKKRPFLSLERLKEVEKADNLLGRLLRMKSGFL